MINMLLSGEADVVETKKNGIDWQEVWQKVVNWITTEGLKFLVALIILLILFRIINIISRVIRKRMIKRNRDRTIISVVYQLIRIGGKLLAFFVFLGYVGINTAGIGTLLASLGVGIGMAIQGSLSNLAGGIVIIIMRPFKLGDFIVAQGQSGTVDDIRIFYTYLITPDNRVVMIPNGTLANGVIVNNNSKGIRRLDNKFSISYDADYNKAVEIIKEIISSHEEVLPDKPVFVRMTEHAASSIEITSKVWVDADNYWGLNFDLIEEVKEAFDREGIEIPYQTINVITKDSESNNENKD